MLSVSATPSSDPTRSGASSLNSDSRSVVAGPTSATSGGHQRDPYSSVADRRQHVAYALVVGRTSPDLVLTVGAEGEDDGVDPVERGGQRLRTGDIADHHVGAGGEQRRPFTAAYEGPHPMSCGGGLGDDVASDAAGGAHRQHSECGHAISPSSVGTIGAVAGNR